MSYDLKDLIRECMTERVVARVLDDSKHPYGKELITLLLGYTRDGGSHQDIGEGIDDLVTRSVNSIIHDWKDNDLNFDATLRSQCGWCNKLFEEGSKPVYHGGRFYHPVCKETIIPFQRQYSDAKPGTNQGD